MLSLFLIKIAAASLALAAASSSKMAEIPAGSFQPFFSAKAALAAGAKAEPEKVEAFSIDRTPVTNAEFLAFVKKNPQWRRSLIPRIFADPQYLQAWKGDLALGSFALPNAPVTSVSWFAAQAYCESRGLSLPTVNQWEYVLYDQGRDREALQARILKWYSKPTEVKFGPVGKDRANGFGLHNLVGLVWEWTLDFNSFMTTNESRASDGASSGLFCGNGSAGALDATDYPSFMRYSFRFSLKAAFVTKNLGFRCATEVKE